MNTYKRRKPNQHVQTKAYLQGYVLAIENRCIIARIFSFAAFNLTWICSCLVAVNFIGSRTCISAAHFSLVATVQFKWVKRIQHQTTEQALFLIILSHMQFCSCAMHKFTWLWDAELLFVAYSYADYDCMCIKFNDNCLAITLP